jgi:hypothetical protein
MRLTVIRLKDTSVDTLDLKILNRTLRKLRHAFKVFSPYRTDARSASWGEPGLRQASPTDQFATEFARLIVEAGYLVITGAADGIMGAAQAGAGKAQGFGLNILLPFDQATLPHLICHDNRRSAGRLRQVIDRINGCEATQDGLTTGSTCDGECPRPSLPQ